MSLYRYRAKDRKGHKYKGIREGENEAQLVKSWQKTVFTVISCKMKTELFP